MPPLTCLFLIQGEGRGHLTQALALRALLDEAGHRVAEAFVGQSDRRTVPRFFLDKMQAPVTCVESPSFVHDASNRGVRPVRTLLRAVRRSPHFRASLGEIHAAVQRHRPDVIVNFYEPMGGVYNALYRPATPMVCIAHQYFFLHPAHQYPPGHTTQREALHLFTRLTALGAAATLALSLYPVPEIPGAPVTIVPPLLRAEVFQQPLDVQDSFFLAYLLNDGYATDIIRWHDRHPEQALHGFWDNPEAAQVECYEDTLTFHRLDDEKFLALMARCRGLITTAGFETIAEAMYLGKPVLAVPVKGHIEQYCNSFDVVKAGAGIGSSYFDIDGFVRFLPSYRSPAPAFRSWLAEGRPRFIQAIEAAAGITSTAVPAFPLDLATT